MFLKLCGVREHHGLAWGRRLDAHLPTELSMTTMIAICLARANRLSTCHFSCHFCVTGIQARPWAAGYRPLDLRLPLPFHTWSNKQSLGTV